MSIISKIRQQKAVLWEKQDVPNLVGEDEYKDPVVIECRWTDEFNLVRTERGEETTSQHKVFVDRELSLGDLLYKGEALPFIFSLRPETSHLVKRVIAKKTLVNLKNTETLYIVYL